MAGTRFGYSVVKIQMDLFLPSPVTLSEMEAKSDDWRSFKFEIMEA